MAFTKNSDDKNNGFLIIKYEFSFLLCKKMIQGMDVFCKYGMEKDEEMIEKDELC